MPEHDLGERPAESKPELPDNWQSTGDLVQQAVAEAERKRRAAR